MRRLLALLLIVAAAGCDGTLDDRLDARLVVSASLGVGEPLPEVQLSRVSPLLAVYDPAEVAVSGATVTVTLLAPDGTSEAVYAYAEAAPGRYAPLAGAASAPEVQPDRTYRLDVEVGGERLTARTTTPPALAVVEGPPSEVTYGTGQGPEVRVSRSSTPARPARFVISAQALDPAPFAAVEVDGETRYRSAAGNPNVPTPAYALFLDCAPEDGGTVLCEDNPDEANITVGTSPVLNEDGYTLAPDGSVVIQVPFLAFGYYGPAEIRITSVDDALEAFVESQGVQRGGSTLSPGEIPNVVTNVQGGLGVFGSFARVNVSTSVRPRG